MPGLFSLTLNGYRCSYPCVEPTGFVVIFNDEKYLTENHKSQVKNSVSACVVRGYRGLEKR